MTRPVCSFRHRLVCSGPLLAAILASALCAATASAQPAAPAADDCPPWAALNDRHDNAEKPGLGCVNRENLRKMVARPGDLSQGRALGPANGARESLGVGAYEQGKVKPFGTDQAMTPAIVVPGTSVATP